MNQKIFLVFFALLAFSGIACASSISGTFSVSTDCIVPAQAVFALSNNKTAEQVFSISASGEAAGWINLNGQWIADKPLQIAVAANSSASLYAFIKPQGCSVAPGTYGAVILVSSPLENFSQKISVFVGASRQISIDVNADSFLLQQCEQKSFQVSVSNTGKSDELVSLSVQGIPNEWIDFTRTQFLLEKNHSIQLNATLKPPCSAQAKQYAFSLKASIQNTSFFAQKSLSLEIADAQKIDFSADAMRACSDTDTTAQIQIKNSGRLDDSIELGFSGPDWIAISPSAMQLKATEQKTITVLFRKSTAKQGAYKFVLKAHSTKFNKDTVQEFSVQLQDCYGVTISSATANGQSAAVPSVCIEEPLVYEFEILNDKANPIDISAAIRGANASIVPSKATISPSSKQVFTAKISLENEKTGDKNFELSLSSSFFSRTEKFSFKIIDCYSLQADYDGLNNAIDINAGDSKANRENSFTVKIKNTGTKSVQAKAEISGPSWVCFQPSAFSLNAGEEKSVYMYLDPPYDTKSASYKATIKISAENVSESRTITVNVYGGLNGTPANAVVSVSGELNSIVQAAEKTVTVDLILKNDSNSALQITDLNAYGFNASFDFTPKTLQPNETLSAEMTLVLAKDFSETSFSVPVQIFTDKGRLVQDIQIDLNAPQKQPSTGFFSLAGFRDTVLVALIAIVIALALVLIFRSGKKAAGNEAETAPISYWKTPSEKPEKAAGTKSLEDAIKKIQSKPKAKRKKPSKPARKKRK